MSLQTIFASKIVRIKVDVAGSYIEIRWLNHPESEVFRSVITRAYQYAHEHQLTKWFCNMEQAEYLELVDQHWLVQEIFTAFNPQLQHDYAYLIRPLVLEVLTTYHIRELVEMEQSIKARINIAVFTDIEQAHHWLFCSTDPAA